MADVTVDVHGRVDGCALLAGSWTGRGLLFSPLRKEGFLQKVEKRKRFRPVFMLKGEGYI